MGEQVSAAAIEAAALRMCRRPRWPASWDEDARDYWRYLAQDALTAALPYLAAHQPARVAPSAEEGIAEARTRYPYDASWSPMEVMADRDAFVEGFLHAVSAVRDAPTVAEVREQVAREIGSASGALAEYLRLWSEHDAAVWTESYEEAATDILGRLANIARTETKGGE